MFEGGSPKNIILPITPVIASGIHIESNIPFLRSTLRHHAELFSVLHEEMSAFTPMSPVEIEKLRERLLKESNSLESSFLDQQVKLLSDPRHLFIRRYSNRFMLHAVPVVVFACALAEALINSMVAVGLSAVSKQNLFVKFEASSMIEKWAIGPTLFSSVPKVAKGEKLMQTLKKMNALRSSLVHSKSDVLDSSRTPLLSVTSDARFDMSFKGRQEITHFAELPDHLFDMVLRRVENDDLRFILSLVKLDTWSISEP